MRAVSPTWREVLLQHGGDAKATSFGIRSLADWSLVTYEEAVELSSVIGARKIMQLLAACGQKFAVKSSVWLAQHSECLPLLLWIFCVLGRFFRFWLKRRCHHLRGRRGLVLPRRMGKVRLPVAHRKVRKAGKAWSYPFYLVGGCCLLAAWPAGLIVPRRG
eukprot:6476913-Amphidinium_carterae.1